ncbi:hypothetical protein ACFYXS_26805 [Streptomyces sp. NPDC002574]|uniref:hypothetical protein n=1 Tax=Streptomyces sp. NPDC002574 TaxID=3364652 RepID=UPI003674C1EE
MIHSPQPPRPDDGDHASVGRRSLGGDGRGTDGWSGCWLRSRRRGRASSLLPLHLGEAFLVGHGGKRPSGGLMRFQFPDVVEARRSRRPWRRRTDVGRQLAGSGGELRLVRGRTSDDSITPQAVIAMLTLNGITDVAPLLRLSIAEPLPYTAGSERGQAAAVGLDVHFFAGLWGLAVPARTRCRVHLEGPVRLLPDWPVPR